MKIIISSVKVYYSINKSVQYSQPSCYQRLSVFRKQNIKQETRIYILLFYLKVKRLQKFGSHPTPKCSTKKKIIEMWRTQVNYLNCSTTRKNQSHRESPFGKIFLFLGMNRTQRKQQIVLRSYKTGNRLPNIHRSRSSNKTMFRCMKPRFIAI